MLTTCSWGIPFLLAAWVAGSVLPSPALMLLQELAPCHPLGASARSSQLREGGTGRGFYRRLVGESQLGQRRAQHSEPPYSESGQSLRSPFSRAMRVTCEAREEAKVGNA
jgi:hypothetical protein